MRRLTVILVFFLLFLGIGIQAQALTLDELQQRGVMRVGLYPKLDPFGYKDDAGDYVGFDVDVITAVADMWDVDVEFVPIATWKDNIPGLVSRKFDVFIAPFTITPKRAKLILFSQPHFNAGQSVVVPKRNRRIKSHNDLRNKKIAVVENSTAHEAAQQIEGVKIVTFSQRDDRITCVLSGKCDALIGDRPLALADVKKNKGKLKIVGNPFTTEFYGYGLNKNDTELLMQLNQAITLLKDQGEWDAIFNKWFK